MENPVLHGNRTVGTHVEKREPGKDSPVQAQEGHTRENRYATQGRNGDRKEVGKTAEHVPRKAAIVYHVPVP